MVIRFSISRSMFGCTEQSCGFYADGQKAYSDGFVVGCTQVGNRQQICQLSTNCQAFADSSILNADIQATQKPTQAEMQSTQGIQPAKVNK